MTTWPVRHPGIGALHYGTEQEAITAAESNEAALGTPAPAPDRAEAPVAILAGGTSIPGEALDAAGLELLMQVWGRHRDDISDAHARDKWRREADHRKHYREKARLILAAAWPHLAAQALRDAARDLAPEAVERVDLMPLAEVAARSLTAGWLRHRADELEGGTDQEGHAT